MYVAAVRPGRGDGGGRGGLGRQREERAGRGRRGQAGGGGGEDEESFGRCCEALQGDARPALTGLIRRVGMLRRWCWG